jgi:hypothetical protein
VRHEAQEVANTFFEYLWRAGDTMKRFILKDFEQRNEMVKEDLRLPKSKIHISFDLWTSTNKLAMLGVVAHYLMKDLTARSLLIGLREVIGAHSGENIAVCILQAIKEVLIVDRVGCFVADDDSPNDTAAAAICRELNLTDQARHRLRCLGHIINLSAKDLLFGKEEGSFDFEVSEMAKLKMEGAPSSRIAGVVAPEGSPPASCTISFFGSRRPPNVFRNLRTSLRTNLTQGTVGALFPQSD